MRFPGSGSLTGMAPADARRAAQGWKLERER
jgi:hypothetical protein